MRGQVLPLEALNILIGPNDAGTSNCAEAIRFVGAVTNQRLALYVLIRSRADKPLHQGRHHTPCSYLQLDFAGDEKRSVANYPGQASARWNPPPAKRFSMWTQYRSWRPLAKDELKAARRHVQLVFQDPFSSLNPRQRVRDVSGEPLKVGYGNPR